MDMNELLAIMLVFGIVGALLGERFKVPPLFGAGSISFMIGFFGLFLPPVISTL